MAAVIFHRCILKACFVQKPLVGAMADAQMNKCSLSSRGWQGCIDANGYTTRKSVIEAGWCRTCSKSPEMGEDCLAWGIRGNHQEILLCLVVKEPWAPTQFWGFIRVSAARPWQVATALRAFFLCIKHNSGPTGLVWISNSIKNSIYLDNIIDIAKSLWCSPLGHVLRHHLNSLMPYFKQPEFLHPWWHISYAWI